MFCAVCAQFCAAVIAGLLEIGMSLVVPGVRTSVTVTVGMKTPPTLALKSMFDTANGACGWPAESSPNSMR